SSRTSGKSYRVSENDVLVAYCMVIASYVFIVAGLWLAMAASGSNGIEISGSVILLITAVGIYCANSTYVRLKDVDAAYDRTEQFNRWKNRTLATEAEAAVKPKASFSTYAKRAAPIMLLAVLLLPYPYEAGGNISIYPMQKSQVAPDVGGIIEAVYFDG